MVESKELYLLKEDKFELELIAAELNAKSVRMFLAELFFTWAGKFANKEPLPEIEILTEAERSKMANVTYLYNGDVNYYARRQAAMNRTNISNFYRSLVHWLCEQHRTDGRCWIDDTPMEDIPVTRRK